MAVLLNDVPRIMVDIHKRYRITYCLHHQGLYIYILLSLRNYTVYLVLRA